MKTIILLTTILLYNIQTAIMSRIIDRKIKTKKTDNYGENVTKGTCYAFILVSIIFLIVLFIDSDNWAIYLGFCFTSLVFSSLFYALANIIRLLKKTL